MKTYKSVVNIIITYIPYLWNEFLTQTEKVRESKSSFKICYRKMCTIIITVLPLISAPGVY